MLAGNRHHPGHVGRRNESSDLLEYRTEFACACTVEDASRGFPRCSEDRRVPTRPDSIGLLR